MAKPALATAVEVNPRFTKAMLLLAEIYLHEHDFDMARKESRKSLKLNLKITRQNWF
jgi:Tfp pilus assembly protein PilF